MNWEAIRQLTERFSWTDAKTGVRVTGFNPPEGAKDVERVAYHVRYVTLKGEVEQGQVVTLKVFPRQRQRMVQFVASKQVRRIRDYLIVSIDGIRIRTT
jgi:citrate lyase beta subunit